MHILRTICVYYIQYVYMCVSLCKLLNIPQKCMSLYNIMTVCLYIMYMCTV